MEAAAEMEIILSHIKKVPDLISGAIGNYFKTPSEQRQYWDDIAEEIAVAGLGKEDRTGKDIKKKLQDYKCRVKKKATAIKNHLNGTGGGEPCKLFLTQLEHKALAAIGRTGVDGVTDENFDSSAGILRGIRNSSTQRHQPAEDSIDSLPPVDEPRPAVETGASSQILESVEDVLETPVRCVNRLAASTSTARVQRFRKRKRTSQKETAIEQLLEEKKISNEIKREMLEQLKIKNGLINEQNGLINVQNGLLVDILNKS